jgi:hypothetical protein
MWKSESSMKKEIVIFCESQQQTKLDIFCVMYVKCKNVFLVPYIEAVYEKLSHLEKNLLSYLGKCSRQTIMDAY